MKLMKFKPILLLANAVLIAILAFTVLGPAVALAQTPPNQPPVANNDTASTPEDTAVGIDVTANDTDTGGNINKATVVISTAPTHGGVSVNSTTGVVTYTPTLNYYGPDSFQYTVNDNAGATSNVATVTITVTPVNDAPAAVDDAYSVDKNGTLNIAMLGVLSNDTDVDVNPLTAVLQKNVTHGALTLNADGSFAYTPQHGFQGIDTFTYFANDGTTNSQYPATVTIDVGNQKPVANNDAYSVDKNGALNIAAPGVLGNDTDLDGNPLTAVLHNNVTHGTLTLNANGSFAYTPSLNFEGIDTFTYFANDGTVNSQNPATVTIDVGNQKPVANNDAYSVNKIGTLNIAALGVLSNDSDLDLNPLTAVLQNNVTHGTLTLNADGSFAYTPTGEFEGIDTFTYFANDGTVNSQNPATVTIDVGNQKPVANNDAYSVDKNGALNIAAPGVLGNDTDLDGNPLTAVLHNNVTHGTLTLNANGSFVYTPTLDFEGVDTFTYFAKDGTVNSQNSATVTINVGVKGPSTGQVPPGQMVRRGLSGPIEKVVGTVEAPDMLFLLIRTNFGLVKVYVPDNLVPAEGFAVGQRVAVKLAPDNIKVDHEGAGVQQGQEEPYRVAVAEVAVAEQVKIVPVQASRSHTYGAEEITVVQDSGSGKQIKGLVQRNSILTRLEALIDEADDTGNEALEERLQQRLEKQEQQKGKAQQHSANSSDNNDDEGQNQGQGKGQGAGGGNGKNK